MKSYQKIKKKYYKKYIQKLKSIVNKKNKSF